MRGMWNAWNAWNAIQRAIKCESPLCIITAPQLLCTALSEARQGLKFHDAASKRTRHSCLRLCDVTAVTEVKRPQIETALHVLVPVLLATVTNMQLKHLNKKVKQNSNLK